MPYKLCLTLIRMREDKMKVQKQSYVYYFFLIFFPGIDEIWFYISKLKGVLFF